MSEDVKDSIGEKLKSRREELGYSLKDAAERTRIRKSYIESLEADRFSSLPGEAYVAGFIKVYAGYLGLDPLPLLALLADKPAEPVSEFTLQQSPQFTKYPTADKKASAGWAAFFVGFIVVLLLGGGLYFLLTKNDSDMSVVEAPVVKQNEVAKETAPGAGDINPPVVAADKPEPPEKAEPAVAEEKKESDTPEQTLATIKKSGSSLRMLAVSDGSLIINVDQRKPQEYVLHDGLDLTWRVKEKVSFEMAEAGQARFWLDGVEVKLGDRESVLITQAP